tara:strand:+ start:364 stop:714 length:351 start_codon:yes stop_codon:yes gene_type:complete
MINTDKYEVAYGKWSVGHEGQHDLPEGDIPINVNGGLMAIAYSQADARLIADAPLLLKEVKNQNYQLHLYQSALRQMQEDTLKVVSDWFDSDENEWRRLEQALGLPLTPLSWEGEE